MDEYARKIRQKLKDDFIHYSSKCLKVRSEEGAIIPFVLNKTQRHIHDLVENQRRAIGRVRAIILKGRQEGCSTYVEGRFYWRVTHRFGVRAFILTHDNDATTNLFEMANRYHEHCPPIVRPDVEASNAKELIFAGLDSGYKLGTAGNKGVGRSSTIQYLHGSEVAYWPNAAEHAKGIIQAVPNVNDTEIFLESTANGIGNYFHQQWQLAETGASEFIPIFIPWFWKESYKKPLKEKIELTEEEENYIRLFNLTAEQINWRRNKIIELSVGGMDGNKAFLQEYPFTAVDAFQTTGEDSFIPPHLVLSARKCITEKYGHLIIGVDPARFGDDRTSIIYRRGRCAYNLRSYRKKDTMEVTGIVHNCIQNDRPAKVCIDIVGLGAGVYDRLCELGHKDILVPCNGGHSALDDERFINKRAEWWGLMKDWLVEQPVQIPDSDSLHADLCGVKYRNDSKHRLALERKEDMKKRGLLSSDEADALSLTFAIPDIALIDSRSNRYKDVAKDMRHDFNRLDRLKKSAYK